MLGLLNNDKNYASTIDKSLTLENFQAALDHETFSSFRVINKN